MGWKRYEGDVKGVLIQGDPSVPPTTWWRHLWLKFFGWKKIAVFVVYSEDAKAGYRVGYKPLPQFGGPKYCTELCNEQSFAMRVGHEDCTFFAINQQGEEVRLFNAKTTTKDDPELREIKLL